MYRVPQHLHTASHTHMLHYIQDTRVRGTGTTPAVEVSVRGFGEHARSAFIARKCPRVCTDRTAEDVHRSVQKQKSGKGNSPPSPIKIVLKGMATTNDEVYERLLRRSGDVGVWSASQVVHSGASTVPGWLAASAARRRLLRSLRRR